MKFIQQRKNLACMVLHLSSKIIEFDVSQSVNRILFSPVLPAKPGESLSQLPQGLTVSHSVALLVSPSTEAHHNRLLHALLTFCVLGGHLYSF